MPSPRKLDIPHINTLFNYCPTTGNLYWKKRTLTMCSSEHAMRSFNNKKAGTVVGSKRNNGKANEYLVVKVEGTVHLVHRLCWAIHHQEQPNYIDHINGNGLDNRITNLRSVTLKENNKNMRLFKTNTSEFCGVGAIRGRWEAHISINNTPINLGVYDTKAEAVAARRAANIIETFHVNHGRN